MRAPLFLLSTAWRSIIQHKGRSLLTIMSIIVGIAAVIATMAIGRGAQEKIRRRIASMGTNTLSMHAGGMSQAGATTITKKKRTLWLRTSDADYLKQICPEIKYLAGSCYTGNKLTVFGPRRILAPATSCEPEYLELSKRFIKYGRSFSPQEVAHRERVVILGSKAASQLFKSTPPLGKTIRIDDIPFTVIGILQEAQNHQSFNDKNLDIFIPLTTGKRLFHPYLADTAVHGLTICVHNSEDMKQVERIVRRAMRARHKLVSGDPDDFTIWNQAGMAAAAEQSSATFNLFLLIVASLSLLVGGIGVSNIMLVSVTERTKEIGIRLALGASPAMILAQFLIESVMLCSIGGVLGVVLGVTAPHIATYFTDWLVIITPTSIILSVAITMLLGILFGFWPARRAARMNVVEALHD